MKELNTLVKRWKTALAIALMLSLSALALAGCTSGSKGNQPASPDTSIDSIKAVSGTVSKGTEADSDSDGIPDSVEKAYGTNPYTADTDGDGINDKEDKAPVTADIKINETGTTQLPITVKDARVEDNAAADHLEITVTNTGNATLDNFDIYYTITDKVNQAQESYYQVLNGFSVNAGETKTVHFDNQVNESGHYYGNMNGLYGTSSNGLDFEIQLHAKGYQPVTFHVEKAEGTAEVAD